MKIRNTMATLLVIIIAMLLLGWNDNNYPSIVNGPGNNAAPSGFDWPQWRGPDRNGISAETGLVRKWPETGPKIVWERELGNGFSAVSIVGGRAYTMFSDGTNEYGICLDATSGKEIWRFKTGKNYVERTGGDGPRSTPVIDGELVYFVSALGKLYALNAVSGKEVWSHDLQEKFDAKIPTWGVSVTPLIQDDRLFFDAGGRSGFALLAFDKRTGQLIWNAYSDQPGYSAPIDVNIGGIPQIIFFTGRHLVSASPEDGTIYWQYEWRTSYDVNAATPVFVPDDKIFISSGYGKGGGLFQVRIENGRPAVESIWQSRTMKNHMATCVYDNGYLYGFDMGTLKCIEASSGEDQWRMRGMGKGTLMLADGMLIILSERGKLVLAEATPDEFTELASAQVLRGKCWTMPSLANGKLFLRNERQLVCIDMKASAYK